MAKRTLTFEATADGSEIVVHGDIAQSAVWRSALNRSPKMLKLRARAPVLSFSDAWMPNGDLTEQPPVPHTQDSAVADQKSAGEIDPAVCQTPNKQLRGCVPYAKRRLKGLDEMPVSRRTMRQRYFWLRSRVRTGPLRWLWLTLIWGLSSSWYSAFVGRQLGWRLEP